MGSQRETPWPYFSLPPSLSTPQWFSFLSPLLFSKWGGRREEGGLQLTPSLSAPRALPLFFRSSPRRVLHNPLLLDFVMVTLPHPPAERELKICGAPNPRRGGEEERETVFPNPASKERLAPSIGARREEKREGGREGEPFVCQEIASEIGNSPGGSFASRRRGSVCWSCVEEKERKEEEESRIGRRREGGEGRFLALGKGSELGK